MGDVHVKFMSENMVTEVYVCKLARDLVLSICSSPTVLLAQLLVRFPTRGIHEAAFEQRQFFWSASKQVRAVGYHHSEANANRTVLVE